MDKRAEDFINQLNELWKQTVEQFDEVRDTVAKAYENGKHQLDGALLKRKRDELLKKLGDQTYRLIQQDKIHVPDSVKRTVEKINTTIDHITRTEQEGNAAAAAAAPAEAAVKKAPAKEAPAKKAPPKKAPSKKAAAKDAPAKDAPAKKTPAKKPPVKKAPGKKAPAKEAPAKGAAKKAPSKKAPSRKASGKKAPAEG